MQKSISYRSWKLILQRAKEKYPHDIQNFPFFCMKLKEHFLPIKWRLTCASESLIFGRSLAELPGRMWFCRQRYDDALSIISVSSLTALPLSVVFWWCPGLEILSASRKWIRPMWFCHRVLRQSEIEACMKVQRTTDKDVQLTNFSEKDLKFLLWHFYPEDIFESVV